MKNNFNVLFVTSILTSISFNVVAKESKKFEHEEIVVKAQGDDIQTAGSATVIDKKTLELYNYQDIEKVLRSVPGVEGYNEDGYGHRPNIGFRGGKSERSQGITLMEDGVLIAPAPYAAPSAYYFPKVERAEEIEILKGAAAIKAGPRTTSGALNIVTKDVPQDEIAEVNASYGSYGEVKAQTVLGKTYDNFGFIMDYNHMEGDGFKKINGERDTGFDINDLVTKFKITSSPESAIYQELEIKYAINDENSKETYLGVTESDFQNNPYIRYAATAQDEFDGQHEQLQLTHYIKPQDNLTLVTKIYNNEFERNWYKLNNVYIGGTKKSLSASLEDTGSYIAALQGTYDTTGSSNDYLEVKANNREYDSKGIDFKANYEFASGEIENNLELGVRVHRDDESRYQKVDEWNIDANGNMVIQSYGTYGDTDSNNKVIEADAIAAYISDEIKFKKLTVTPGLRFEHIDYQLTQRVSNTVTENSIDEVMPAISVNYAVNDKKQLFASISKGFSPATNTGSNTTDNEESVNYEIGTRAFSDKVDYELVGFFNDYSNLLGTCTESTGCSGNIGDQFDGGEVNSYGVEFSLKSNLSDFLKTSYKLPVKIAYTYTVAEFRNSFQSSYDIWNAVTVGDNVPYVPTNSVFASLGYEINNFTADLSVKYQDEMNAVADGSEQTDSYTIYDIAANYKINDHLSLNGQIQNVLDEKYVASRTPYGIRVNAPRLFYAGLKYKF